jgi:Ubiquitin family
MSFIFNFLSDFVQAMLELFSFGKKKIKNKLSIFIKTTNGQSLSVDLDPKWDIKEVKEFVAPQLGMQPEEVKIIFAGKELEDSTTISVSFLFDRNLKAKITIFFFLTRSVTWASKVFCMLSKPALA